MRLNDQVGPGVRRGRACMSLGAARQGRRLAQETYHPILPGCILGWIRRLLEWPNMSQPTSGVVGENLRTLGFSVCGARR